MKTKELIELLKQANPDADVYIAEEYSASGLVTSVDIGNPQSSVQAVEIIAN